MQKLWIIGGTTEARELLEYIKTTNFDIFVSVATDYGMETLSYLKNYSNIHIISQRMDASEMEKFIYLHNFCCAIDATHPHAVIVSEEIKKAALATNIPYLNLERSLSFLEDNENIVSFDSISDAVLYLNNTSGNIFAVTGAKEISKYSDLINFKERLYARVLPMEISLKACTNLGLNSSHIICMQGPFSKTLNIEMLKYAEAKFMVTKNSGDYGGLSEKIDACKELSIKTVLIKAPSSNSGLNIDEVLTKLEQFKT